MLRRQPGRLRCWAHLLRDISDLVKVYPEDEQLRGWAESVGKLYRKGKLYTGLETPGRKLEASLYLEREASALCEPYLKNKDSPQHTLCKRIERYLGELFVYVWEEGVPSDNNAAERDLRQLVVTRKISGGTRSRVGTETKPALTTLYTT